MVNNGQSVLLLVITSKPITFDNDSFLKVKKDDWYRSIQWKEHGYHSRKHRYRIRNNENEQKLREKLSIRQNQ